MESAAYKYGVQCWPDTTGELVDLLKLRQQQSKCAGWYRIDGELNCTYSYELAHRFPASHGGRLVAENLVIMPAVLNRKMGSRHGLGLECYQANEVKMLPKKELRREFLRRYDVASLEGFAKANDTGSDFSTDGIGVFEVVRNECKRLCFTYETNNEIMEDFTMTVNKYNEICSNEKASLMTLDVSDALAMMDTEKQSQMVREITSPDLDWLNDDTGTGERVALLMTLNEEVIIKLSSADFRVALEDANELSPMVEEENCIYHLLQNERKLRNKCLENGDDRWW
ncbi:hypothetical protein ITG08_05920 [Vibrio cyclitrophicus]|uniref:hypothetical protein n=1 Tax=Vibrio cyclitrophicus TaxID=47951 RepID=UPI0020634335|nr:hypothetical protein [Vibrio cyclitrophicus]UPR26284.1 hypothetical protein ITG08_05920 [Vibrio cyclitrophicus]